MEPDVPTVSVEGLSQPLQHCQSEEQVKETQQKINKLIKVTVTLPLHWSVYNAC